MNMFNYLNEKYGIGNCQVHRQNHLILNQKPSLLLSMQQKSSDAAFTVR